MTMAVYKKTENNSKLWLSHIRRVPYLRTILMHKPHIPSERSKQKQLHSLSLSTSMGAQSHSACARFEEFFK